MNDLSAIDVADTPASASTAFDAEAADALLEDFLDHLDAIDRDLRWTERFELNAASPVEGSTPRSAPFIFEFGDIRSLLANWGYVQSAMSISDPYRLVLQYTQAMMGFLLFNPSPKTIEIIGLGGGSLAKYCHGYLPDASIRAVEVDWNVIELADQFQVPTASERFETIWDDGANFVVNDWRKTDVLLVDGFDSCGQPSRLCSEDFYMACRERLTPDGVFVANLCNLPGRNQPFIKRLRTCFYKVISVPAEAGMNVVVFAGSDSSLKGDDCQLADRAGVLQRYHPIPMVSFASNLCRS